jgi:hypothetical protein
MVVSDCPAIAYLSESIRTFRLGRDNRTPPLSVAPELREEGRGERHRPFVFDEDRKTIAEPDHHPRNGMTGAVNPTSANSQLSPLERFPQLAIIRQDDFLGILRI